MAFWSRCKFESSSEGCILATWFCSFAKVRTASAISSSFIGRTKVVSFSWFAICVGTASKNLSCNIASLDDLSRSGSALDKFRLRDVANTNGSELVEKVDSLKRCIAA